MITAATRVAPEKAVFASALSLPPYMRMFLRGTAMHHYVYRLEASNPIDDRVLYIGARSCQCVPKDDTEYFSSSKHVKKAIRQGVRFVKVILSEHPTRKTAIAEEVRLHELHSVSTDCRYFNVAKQTSVGWDTGGTTLTESHRRKQGAWSDKFWSTAEGREKACKRMKEVLADADKRKKWSLVQKERYKDPKQRQLTSEATKKACANPEIRKIKSSAMQRVWDERPEHRARHSELMKQFGNTPAEREKRSKRMKKNNPMRRNEVRKAQIAGARAYGALKKEAAEALNASFRTLKKETVMEWARQNGRIV